jgi:DNA-directed RNA polymerase specialized sigma24 family protein
LNSLDILSRESDYEKVAASRGVRDAQGVAGETMARLWQKQRDGLTVTDSVEGLVLNGFIIDALRREKNETPAPAALDPDREPYPPLPRPVPGLDASLFARSLRESLLAMPRVQAVCWALVNLCGLTHAEAALILRVSRQRVTTAAEEARLRLMKDVIV